MNTLKLLFLLAFFFTANALASQYKIEHLEPAFWWTGMHNKTLQLMVHGKNISKLTPQVKHQGVEITQVHKTNNKNYLFIDLTLAESVKAGTFNLIFSKAKQQVLQYQYQLKKRRASPVVNKSFSSQDVIYLITPDRFANGDISNDEVDSLIEQHDRVNVGGRHGGDIQGIIDHLDYIADMGFSQIWPMPMIENNQENYSYHGYSATDFYNIDARFGNNSLYKELAAKAQIRGIGLIKDVVLNHIGSGHWWLKDLPAADWLNHQDYVSQETVRQKTPFAGTNHKRVSLHDPHGVFSDQQAFSDGWFVPTMPDLNQKNPFLATYLIQNTIWWIEYANLSGLRVDTYSYSDKTFLTAWTKRLTAEYPSINIVGEEWTTNPAIVSYWQRGKHTHDGYQSYLPSLFDFPLQEALVNSLNQEEQWNSGLIDLYQTLANDFQYADADNLVIFPDNHDMSRLYTQLNQDPALFNIALTYMLTTRGIPQIYYGTEIQMENPGTTDHGVIRTDFPGGWAGDKVNAFTGKGLTTKQNAAKKHLKQLLNWRKTASAIHNGKLSHYAPVKGLYVYFRQNQEQTLMIAINKSEQAVNIVPTRYKEIINQQTSAIDVLSNELFSLKDGLNIPAKSARIWQLN